MSDVRPTQRDLFEHLSTRARAGDAGVIARLVTVALSGGDAANTLFDALRGRERRAHVVGVTGPPGSGKSTLVSALAHAWPHGGRTAILAIDPTSPISGGAILGDRVRMKQISGDPRIYMRSVATHGRTDGLAAGIERATDLLCTLNFDVVIIETVGVGQVEIDITSLADTTVAVFTPGQGDVVQAIKAGLNEVADVLVVNKTDLGGADAVIRDLRRVTRTGVESADDAANEYQRRVLGTCASDTEGLMALIDCIGDHRAFLERSGEGARRRVRRGELQVESTLSSYWKDALAETLASSEGQRIAEHVSTGEVTAYESAPTLLRGILVRAQQLGGGQGLSSL